MIEFVPGTTIESAVWETIGAIGATSDADRVRELGVSLINFIKSQIGGVGPGDMASTAIAIHELYMASLSAGFTEHQAMYIIGEFVKGAASK